MFSRSVFEVSFLAQLRKLLEGEHSSSVSCAVCTPLLVLGAVSPRSSLPLSLLTSSWSQAIPTTGFAVLPNSAAEIDAYAAALLRDALLSAPRCER